MDYTPAVLLALAIALPIGLLILLIYLIAKTPSEFNTAIDFLRQMVNEIRDLFKK